MSLQAIFDPVVRSYFENKYGGSSGGGSSSGTKAVYYRNGDTFLDEVTTDGETMCKISNEIPTMEELEGGFFAIKQDSESELYGCIVSTADGNLVEMNGIATINYMVVFASEDVASTLGIPSGGAWIPSALASADVICVVWNA